MQNRFNQTLLTSSLNFATRDMLYYPSIAICALDAVFSIRANYCSTVVPKLERFCSLYQIPWQLMNTMPAIENQLKVSEVIKKMNGITGTRLATALDFHQPATTTKDINKKILKTEAFIRFINTLAVNGIETYQDLNGVTRETEEELRETLKKIPGQRVSVDYFFMLTGDIKMVKVDRHIENFTKKATGVQNLSHKQIVDLYRNGAVFLQEHGYPDMNPRHLDHIVWEYQKKNKKV